jgi:hypothetical protein
VTLDPREHQTPGRRSSWSNLQTLLASATEARVEGDLDLLTPIDLVNPGVAIGQAVPFTQGVCLAKGLLTDATELRLLDPLKQAVGLTTQTLASWSDGSPKWVLCDWLADGLPAGRTSYWLARSAPGEAAASGGAGDGAPSDSERIRLERDAAGGIHGRAGNVTCEVVDGQLRLYVVTADGRECQAQLLFPLIDRAGRRREPRLEELAWETHGPIRSVVRISGKMHGCRGLRFSARLSLYRGASLMKVEVTLHNERRARHRGGLWDLGDRGSFFFRGFGVEMHLPDGWRRRAALRVEPGSRSLTAGREGLVVYQDSSGGENWRSCNHVNHQGRVPCRFRGYRAQRGDEQCAGERAAPVLSVSDGQHWLAVGMPEFWQQFPKALGVSGDQVDAAFFPIEWDSDFELQGGERKSHVLWIRGGSGDEPPADALDWVHHPPRAVLPPGWYAASGVFPELLPAGGRASHELAPVVDGAVAIDVVGAAEAGVKARQRFEQLMGDAIHGENSLLVRRETIDEFGWRNYGEVWADHEQVFCPAPRPVVSHYNNQFDLVLGGILQLARTGDPAWYEMFDSLARHVVDIDLYHTRQDRAAYNGGLFWFTDHYLPVATSSHRTYSKANRPAGQAYGGGPGPEHNFTTGLLHYYYLTGEQAAADAVRSLADWVLAMDDGQRTPWGLIDASPTGLASGFKSRNMPNRAAANSLRALVDAWLLTRERAYLSYAEQIVARVVHPADDIASLNLLDAEKHWSYTMFLAELARYLDVKGEGGLWDASFDDGISSLVHYARWMVMHERPYLDQSDKLEYPTEAWAAQEFRKANVIRLATRYIDDPERGEWLAFAERLADRAWDDLWGFDSRDTSRALAVVMVEGTRDAYFRRSRGARKAYLDWHPTAAPRKAFVPQRLAARRRMSHPSGWLRLAARLAHPGWWPWILRRLREYL